MPVVTTSSTLEATPAVVWDRLQRIDLLQEVARPLLEMSVPAGTPPRWETGRTVPLTSRLFGVVPFGTQHVTFTAIDHDAMRAETHEAGDNVDRWDHVMTVAGPENGPAVLTDEVTIEAPRPVVWFARRLYAHRHRRWERLAPLLA